MRKTCNPQPTPSPQDKIQTTKPLAPPNLKWAETMEKHLFFLRLRRFHDGIHKHSTAFIKKPDFENNFASAAQGVVLLWHVYIEAKNRRAKKKHVEKNTPTRYNLTTRVLSLMCNLANARGRGHKFAKGDSYCHPPMCVRSGGGIAQFIVRGKRNRKTRLGAKDKDRWD